jgi:hypothetical protein
LRFDCERYLAELADDGTSDTINGTAQRRVWSAIDLSAG